MKNDGGYVFPRPLPDIKVPPSEALDLIRRYSGMSLRDYFAAHAPAEVPPWFNHVPPYCNFPPLPDWQTVADRDDREMARQWLDDGCFDLPAHLAHFAEQVRVHREGREAWGDEDAAARFVQWRWAYADMMLSARA